jgi:phage/plasmid-associated DNA primase
MYLCLASELDSDPDILNVRNGVIDLRTGQLDVHTPAYGCTVIADVDYKVTHPSIHLDSLLFVRQWLSNLKSLTRWTTAGIRDL